MFLPESIKIWIENKLFDSEMLTSTFSTSKLIISECFIGFQFIPLHQLAAISQP